jgi:hypothetical protein
MNPFRYPDKPAGEIEVRHLADFDTADRGTFSWLCKLKMDGWRCLVERIANLNVYYSSSGKLLSPKPEVTHPFEEACRAAGLADALVDCELTGNRRAGDASGLFVLDMLQIGRPKEVGFHNLWAVAAIDRWGMVQHYFPKLAVPAVTSAFVQFYYHHQRITPLAEGVVLKRLDSTFIGSTRDNAKNHGWIKCKWRAGESGTTFKE